MMISKAPQHQIAHDETKNECLVYAAAAAAAALAIAAAAAAAAAVCFMLTPTAVNVQHQLPGEVSYVSSLDASVSLIHT